MAKERKRLIYTFRKKGDNSKKRYLYIDSRVIVSGILAVICLVMLFVWPSFRYCAMGYVATTVTLGLIAVFTHVFHSNETLSRSRYERRIREYIDKYG